MYIEEIFLLVGVCVCVYVCVCVGEGVGFYLFFVFCLFFASGKMEMFYLKTYSTYFIDGYMMSDIGIGPLR